MTETGQPRQLSDEAWQNAKDLSRLVARGATMGFADHAAGYLRGSDAEAERAKSNEAINRQGVAGHVAEAAGSLYPMVTAGTLAGPGAGLAARMGWGALEGAGWGTLSAAGHGEDQTMGAAIGAAGGAVAAPVASVASKIGRAMGRGHKEISGQVPKVPTTAELKAMGNPEAQAAARKAEAVESALLDAELTANPERATRTLIGRLAKQGGMTPDEFAAAMDASKGGLVRNATRLTGDLLAPHGPLGGTSIVGAGGGLLAGYPSAIAAPVVGAGAKFASDRITRAKVNRLAELMRAGGTEEARSGAPNMLQRASKASREAIAKAILAGEISLAPVVSDHGGLSRLP
jgi:hypothetical protein